MKNELGIEVCCDNCYLKYDCNLPVENACRIDGQHLSFLPSIEASAKRIKELQEQVKELESENNGLNEYYQQQQFTEEELQFIKNRLDECIEEWDVPEMVFTAHQILKKIEQALKK